MIQSLSCSFITLTFLGILAAVPAVFAAEPTAEELAFFEKKIRPVLVQKCYTCHSANSQDDRPRELCPLTAPTKHALSKFLKLAAKPTEAVSGQ